MAAQRSEDGSSSGRRFDRGDAEGLNRGRSLGDSSSGPIHGRDPRAGRFFSVSAPPRFRDSTYRPAKDEMPGGRVVRGWSPVSRGRGSASIRSADKRTIGTVR